MTAAALLPGPTETNFFHWADMDDTTVGASKKDDLADSAEMQRKMSERDSGEK